jgi:ribosomal protein L37AE/L43A
VRGTLRRRYVLRELLAQVADLMPPLAGHACPCCARVWGAECATEERVSAECWECDGHRKRWRQYERSTAETNGVKFGYEGGLSAEYLQALWRWQRECCGYSDVQLSQAKGARNAASLERINPLLPYVPGNVLWILWALNTGYTGRQGTTGSSLWSRAKVELVCPLQQGVVDLDVLRASLDEVLHPQARIITRPNQCPECERLCDASELRLEGGSWTCATCRAEFVAYLCSLGHFTPAELCTRLLEVGGRCQVSGVPVRLARNSAWSLTVQRIDTKGPLTLDNLLLVAREFNEGMPHRWRWVREPEMFRAVFGAELRTHLPRAVEPELPCLVV